MPWTTTDIANQALLRMGSRQISSIDDDSEPAPTLKALLDSVARRVQSSFPWQELVRREEIAANPTDDADGRKRYQLPSDTLRVLAVNPLLGADVEYQLEGSFVLTDEATPVTVEYLRYEGNPAVWSIHLAGAVWTALAAEAVMALSQNSNLAERLAAEAARALDEGRRLQSADNKAHSYLPRFHRWRRVRRGGYPL